jgi:enoyl-CoA hydratase
MSDLVLRADSGGVVQLTLNRPEKLNALNVALFEALEAQVSDLEKNPPGVVVLRGAGRCFSAGHDLGDIATGERLPRPTISRMSSSGSPICRPR